MSKQKRNYFEDQNIVRSNVNSNLVDYKNSSFDDEINLLSDNERNTAIIQEKENIDLIVDNTKVDIIDGYKIVSGEPEDEEENVDDDTKKIKQQILDLEMESVSDLDFLMRNLYDEIIYDDEYYSCLCNFYFRQNIFKKNKKFNLNKSIIVSNADNFKNELIIEKLFSTGI